MAHDWTVGCVGCSDDAVSFGVYLGGGRLFGNGLGSAGASALSASLSSLTGLQQLE